MKIKLVLLFVLLVILTGCYQQAAVSKDSAQTDKQLSIYSLNQPIPSYSYSPERDRFIQLYNFRMQSVSTFTVVTTNMGGVPIWSCPSSGYPIPADVQLTNPLQLAPTFDGRYAGDNSVIEQMEPNGLYSSKNTVGTWVFCVTSTGIVTPVYTELNATAFPFVVAYNSKTGMLERIDDTTPSVVIQDKK